MTSSNAPPRISLRFWGVRGSIPTPEIGNLGFGGNTTCLQIKLPGTDEVILIDAGTGLRLLGEALQHSGQHSINTHLLMTHFHSDHIQGVPFFPPLFHAANEIHIYSDRKSEAVRDILEGQMASPYFPVPFSLAAAQRNFIHLDENPISICGAMVTNFPLNHPQGACGYRIESQGAVIVHASDHEHGRESIDQDLRAQCEGADLLIYDAQYTPEEYSRKRGWGHSTYVQGARLAKEANVKHLILFHHDPLHNDEFLKRMVDEARTHFENTDAAREGWEVVL